MQTLYIDVYFLINFTVDVLAVYFAVLLSKITTSRIRLILCGLIGAISACLTVILELNTVFYVINLLFSVLIIVL